MTITYSLDHVPSSTESVLVEVAPKSEFTLVSSDIDPKTGAVTTTYQLASGDNAWPATVVYQSVLQDRPTGKVRFVSVTFNTWARASNDVSGIDTVKPVSAKASFTMPGDMTIEVADFDDLIGTLFSFQFASQSSGARNTGYISKLLYGASQVA
jgi:hypothetical protein